ncbi:MAG: class I SAM-dependent methyltransferase [Cyanobium sp. M30B3]|nr:MAG: class I SAM-dependent methyltransferase [Cyanobium sp. M30B3]
MDNKSKPISDSEIDPYVFENGFYLHCSPSRIGKLISHYHLYQKIINNIPGSIIEFGVFKGSSLFRFAAFRSLFETPDAREIVGFDTFGDFPTTSYEPDQKALSDFLALAGNTSIDKDDLINILKSKGVERNIELIKGDILETLPSYIASRPQLRASIIHLDVDVYKPSKCVLDYAYPILMPGGVLILDDYGLFPGATRAVDDFFANRPEAICSFSFSRAPAYVIKQKQP